MTTPIAENLKQIFESYPSIQFCKSKKTQSSQFKAGVVQAPENPNCLKEVYVKVCDDQKATSRWQMLFIGIFSLQLQVIPPQYLEKFIHYLSFSKKILLEKSEIDHLKECCKRSDLKALSPSALFCLIELFERGSEEIIPHLEQILTLEKLEAIVKQGRSSIKNYMEKKVRALETKDLQKFADLRVHYKLETQCETQEVIQALSDHKYRVYLYSLINQVGKLGNPQKRDQFLEYLFSVFKKEEDIFCFFPEAMNNKPLQFFEKFIKNLFNTREVILENEDVEIIAEFCKTCNLADAAPSTLFYLIQLFEIGGSQAVPGLEGILDEEKLKTIVREGQSIIHQKVQRDLADEQFRIYYYSTINQIGKFSNPDKRNRLLECLFSIFSEEEDIVDYLLATEEEDSSSMDAEDSYDSRASSYSYVDMEEDSSEVSGSSDEVSSYGSKAVIEEIEDSQDVEEPFIETALLNVIWACQNPINSLFSRGLNAITETLNSLPIERAASLKLLLNHSVTEEQRRYFIKKYGEVFFFKPFNW